MTTQSESIVAYKGFDWNLVCNPAGTPFQYEIGKTYVTSDTVVRCARGGFHSCGYPLDVFSYYPPAKSRYAQVTAGRKIARDPNGGDTKIASASITIDAELRIPDLVSRAIEWITSRCALGTLNYATGFRSAASSTGLQSAASSTGNRSAASSTGDQSAASSTGDQSAVSSTGDQSAASSTGFQSAASSTGVRSAASSTGDQSAASSTGFRSAASSTGNRSAASSTGDQSAVSSTGFRSASSADGMGAVACALGYESRAKAAFGGAIVVCARNHDGTLRHIRAAIVGPGSVVKADTWYALSQDGEFVEVQS